VQSVESQQKFRNNVASILRVEEYAKQEIMKQVASKIGFFLGSLIDPEDGSNVFHRSVS
jgi:hypothetical protein